MKMTEQEIFEEVTYTATQIAEIEEVDFTPEDITEMVGIVEDLQKIHGELWEDDITWAVENYMEENMVAMA